MAWTCVLFLLGKRWYHYVVLGWSILRWVKLRRFSNAPIWDRGSGGGRCYDRGMPSFNEIRPDDALFVLDIFRLHSWSIFCGWGALEKLSPDKFPPDIFPPWSFSPKQNKIGGKLLGGNDSLKPSAPGILLPRETFPRNRTRWFRGKVSRGKVSQGKCFWEERLL